MADETIAGGRELDAFLQQLPVKVEKNILRAALRAGVNEYKGVAARGVPVDEGDLKRSLRVTTRVKKGTVYASLKVGGRAAPHAHLVEFGTKPHKIRPKSKKALSFGGKAAREVNHPGARPQPFMRPAADTAPGSAISAVASKIRERMTKENLNTRAPENS